MIVIGPMGANMVKRLEVWAAMIVYVSDRQC